MKLLYTNMLFIDNLFWLRNCIKYNIITSILYVYYSSNSMERIIFMIEFNFN